MGVGSSPSVVVVLVGAGSVVSVAGGSVVAWVGGGVHGAVHDEVGGGVHDVVAGGVHAGSLGTPSVVVVVGSSVVVEVGVAAAVVDAGAHDVDEVELLEEVRVRRGRVVELDDVVVELVDVPSVAWAGTGGGVDPTPRATTDVAAAKMLARPSATASPVFMTCSSG